MPRAFYIDSMNGPDSPRLFLVDGYGLIYRGFFALISRPLTTSKGENTSASWGIANFLRLLMTNHRPDYLGWVHDSGLSFRHERYPAYKATREKLTEELQSDFDRDRKSTRLNSSHTVISYAVFCLKKKKKKKKTKRTHQHRHIIKY